MTAAELQRRLDAAGVRFFRATELLRIRHPSIARDVGITSELFECTDAEAGELVKVALVADLLRGRFGAPLVVLNGLRPRPYNDRVTKAKNSKHVYGMAIDLTCSDMPRLRAVAQGMFDEKRVGGLGLYRGNIHIDTRKRQALWGSQA